MAKGAIAKDKVEKKIVEAFGENFLGIHDRKLYVMANDGGEMVQIAISLTCPKTPVEFDKTINTGGDWDWSGNETKVGNTAVAVAEPAEITEEEVENLKTLLEKLGL